MRAVSRFGWFGALALCYLWFVDVATRDEAIAAVLVAWIAVTVMGRVWQRSAPPVRLPLAGIGVMLRRIPFAAVRESYDILLPVLWNALVRRRSIAGRWIALRYDPDDGSDAFGRRTLVLFGSSITPNALPLALDAQRGRLYLHQLVARREAAADDPRFPI